MLSASLLAFWSPLTRASMFQMTFVTSAMAVRFCVHQAGTSLGARFLHGLAPFVQNAHEGSERRIKLFGGQSHQGLDLAGTLTGTEPQLLVQFVNPFLDDLRNRPLFALGRSLATGFAGALALSTVRRSIAYRVAK